MSEKPISCGGFKIDNETIVEQNGVLKVVGGSSGGGSLKVTQTTTNPEPDTTVSTLDKTWQEIYDALNDGLYVVLVKPEPEIPVVVAYPIYTAAVENSGGDVFTVYVSETRYATNSANGYPSYTSGGK